ncbi:TorF family putative porin [Sphingomonas sp. KR1UV-12]|uniref:TorF family putative porin n=1 Tax=Sphingomonas aurea TaxID=3063994 RepID=A0ABT9EHJ0_9SPHN|nr:TorF family putative porin [Sphingomonas sp. KR1UV-12]MDP1026429.1 TorF family putative porin [Sphingomonas sp. KR1UV-12]
MSARYLAALAAACTVTAPAGAQTTATVGAELTNDEVRRGLSWSEGRASVSGDAFVDIGPIDASARIVATRGSERHAGADAVADLTLGTGWDMGAVSLRATATGHLFAGARTGMDYVELGSSAAAGLGPARLTAGVLYAPSQDAIGGDNLYLYASADSGIPGTPLTVIAEIGHSSGSVDDSQRAQRLRPGGSYTDWRLGVERRRGPLTLGLSYIGTDVDQGAIGGPYADLSHAGDRIVGRVRVEF